MFTSPVSALTLDAQASQDYDGLDSLLECAECIILDEEDFLPLAVSWISELADVGKPSERRRRDGRRNIPRRVLKFV